MKLSSLLFPFFLSIIGFSSSLLAQTITTDEVDYLPGDQVITCGEGWLPFEKVQLRLKRNLESSFVQEVLFTCDAHGQFQKTYYDVVPTDWDAFFILEAAGQESGHISTAAFNDGRNDYSIDFSAYDPNYYTLTGFDSSLQIPSGRGQSPLGNTAHQNTVESLAPARLGLGQVVAYEYFVRVDAGGACYNDTISIHGEWETLTTNGGNFGFDPNHGVVAAFVDSNPNDLSVSDQGSLATVSALSWNLDGTTIEGAIEIAGLDPGDEIAVEVWLVLKDSMPGSLGGNVQSRVGSAELSGVCEINQTKINVGNQTIPLKQINKFFTESLDISIEISDSADPISGDSLSYQIIIHNNGPAVSNQIEVQSVLDPNATYIPNSWDQDGDSGSAWSLDQQSDTLVFSTSFLDVGETVVLNYDAELINENTSMTGVGGDACSGTEDVCTSATISSLGSDSDISNNSTSEATGLECPPFEIIVSSNPTIVLGDPFAFLVYDSLNGNPEVYHIDFEAGSESAGFSDLVDQPLDGGPILLSVPVSAGVGVYHANITISQSSGSCQSEAVPFSLIINASQRFDACDGTSIGQVSTNSWNAAWVDFDKDQWEDLYITNKDPQQPNQLYSNNGDGSFTKVQSNSLISFSHTSVSSSWADIDNDNDLDVFIINATEDQCQLFLNDGTGNFTEQFNSGISEDPEYSHGAAWLDYDNDGYVDLLMTNFFETRFHYLYHNEGDGTFSRTYNTLTQESARSLAPIIADYDNDGWVDVFIPNGSQSPNSLFRNLGNGTFEKITNGALVTDIGNSVGASWGDYNNDGWIDLVVVNSSGQNNNLFQNNGDGTFQKDTASIVSQQGGHSHGVQWLDLDNDADLDLLITNDQDSNYLYLNDGTGNFSREFGEGITQNVGNTMGSAWADFDKDGDLDVFLSTHSNQTNKLFCNQHQGNNWVRILLLGTNSNASAIGSRIKLKSGGIWQTRQVVPQSGFGSQSSLYQHFGLKQASTIDSIAVFWPSGHVQYLSSLSPNQTITIQEDLSSVITGKLFQDLNGNCVQDAGEEAISHTSFSVSPGQTMLTTDQHGEYQIRLPNGNYQFDINENNSYWDQTCSGTIQVDSSLSQAYQHDIGLSAQVTATDLFVSYGTTAWRRGFSNPSNLIFGNNGTVQTTNIWASVTYPQHVVLQSSFPAWDSISGNTYYWYIDTLEAGSNLIIQLTDSVTLNTAVGQTLNISGSIPDDGSDLNPDDNQFSEDLDIVGAIDPNDMLVSPKGDGTEGFIRKDQLLTYTIRFQNVGTFMASRVILENQIPENLDMGSFQNIKSSHSYQYSMDETGNLTVIFNQINLIDSTTNEAESHGFFTYSILPNPIIQGGEKIENQATITFDYELPMATNIVSNTIKQNYNINLSLMLSPNPAQQSVSVDLKENYVGYQSNTRLSKIFLYDLVGQLVYRQEIASRGKTEIDLSAFQKGIYIVVGVDSVGRTHSKKLIVE